MPSLSKCLKTIKISKADRIQVTQIARVHKKDGLSSQDASNKAVEDMLSSVRKDYNSLDAEVAQYGGAVEPVEGFEAQYETVQRTAPEVASVDPEADARISSPEDDGEVLPTFANVPFKRGAQGKAETMLSEAGLEPAEILWALEPGADGKVGIKEVRKAIKRVQDADDGVGAESVAGADGADPAAELESIIARRTALYEATGDFSPEAELELAVDIQNFISLHNIAYNPTQQNSGATADIAKLLMAGMDAVERDVVKGLAYTMKKKGMSQSEADALAVLKYLTLKAEQQSKKIARREADVAVPSDPSKDGLPSSGVGRTSQGPTQRITKELETGSTKAGIGDQGIQGILKQGGGPRVNKRLAGVETVEDEANKTTSAIAREAEGTPVEGLETAMALTQMPRRGPDGKMVKSNAAVRYIALERVKTADSEVLKPGDEGWYDSMTNKSYKNEDNMRMARGEKPLPKSGARSSAQTSSLMDRIAGLLNDPEAMAREAAKTQARIEHEISTTPEVAATIAKADAGTKIDAGQRLAIMNPEPRKDGKHQVRVLSTKQMEDGIGLAGLLGKSKPDSWVIGQVADDVKSGYRSPEAFTPRNPDDAVVIPPERIPNESMRSPTVDDLRDIPVDRNADQLSDDIHVLYSSHFKRAVIPAQGITAADVVRLSHSLESTRWGQNEGTLAATLADLTMTYKYLARVAPNGVELPKQSKLAAITNVEDIFQAYDSKTINGLRRLINGLAGDEAPIIAQGRGSSFDPNIPGRGRAPNEIKVGMDGRIFPAHADLAHEIGHWAYLNILSYQDRLSFWGMMGKYYDETGTLDKMRLASKLPDTKGEGAKVGKSIRTNSFDSPNELFANQFAMMTIQDPRFQLDNPVFWKKMARYIKGIYDNFMDKKRIDSDLEPLFAKILPDETQVKKMAASKTISKKREFTKPVSKFIVHNYNELEATHALLRESAITGDPNSIIADAVEMVRLLFKLMPSPKKSIDDSVTVPEPPLNADGTPKFKRGDPELKKFTPRLPNSFGPLHAIQRQMRSKANQLAHILNGEKGDNVGTLKSKPFEDSDLDDAGFQDYEWVPPEGTEAVHNYQNKEKVAENIVDFLSDDTKKYGSLDDMMDLAQTTLTKQLRKSEGEDVFDGDLPSSMKERGKDLPPENENTKRFRKRHQAAKANSDKAMKDQAAALQAAKTGDKLESSGVELPQLKGMSSRQLVNLYGNHQGTSEGEQILREVVRQTRTEAPPESVGNVSKDFKKFLRTARAPELNSRLKTSLDEGKKNEATGIISEMQRRQENKRLESDAAPKIEPFKSENDFIRAAVSQEKVDATEGIVDGIPVAARLTIREALSYFPQRSPDMQDMTRTMAYRMFNMMGRAARATTEDANVMSMSDVYKLSRIQEHSQSASSVAVDFTSPEFKLLRNDLRRITVGLNKGKADPFDLMHEIGHVISRTNVLNDTDRSTMLAGYMAADDAIKANVNRRKYNNLSDQQVLNRQAEEWFVEHWTQYLGERVAKGNMFDARMDKSMEGLELRGRLSTMVDRLVEGVAYFTNGMIGRQDIKQTFRRLTLYGDMLAKPKTGYVRPRSDVMAAEVAPDRFDQALNEATPTKRKRIGKFVGDGAVDEGGKPIPYYHASPNMTKLQDGEVVFRASDDGNTGPGVYISRDAGVADAVYASRPTRTAWQRLIADGDLPEGKKLEAIELSSSLHEYHSIISTNQVARQRIMNDISEGVDVELNKAELDRTNDLLEGLEAMADDAFDTLKDMDVGYNPGVLPVYIRVLNPFDATDSSEYTAQDSVAKSIVKFAHDRILNNGGGDDIIDRTLGKLTDSLNNQGFMRGNEIYGRATDGMVESGMSPKEARTTLNRWLGEQGYDGIDSTHQNTVRGNRVPHITTALIDTPDGRGGWENPSNRIKHQDAEFFDKSDDRLYYSEPLEQPVNSTMLSLSLSDEAFEPSSSRIDQLLQNAEEKGSPREFTNAASKIAKGRVLTDEDVNGIHSASVATRTLRSNSDRQKLNGLNWIADYFDDFFPASQQMFASMYMPIRSMLNTLPDSDGIVRKWARRSNPFGASKAQPETHTRILSALRRGVGTPHYNKLSMEERKIADQIRETMNKVNSDMVEEGAMVGNIKNYMPQIWDTDKIKEDSDGFIDAITTYLYLENPMRASDEAGETAGHIMANVVNDDGLYIPPPVPHSGGVEGSLDFQRLIRTDKHPGSLQKLEPFMQNNLNFLLVKYLDGASKRIQQTKKMGVNIHAFSDYLDVGQNGSEAIVRLLSRPKVFTKAIKGQDSLTGTIEESSLENVINMPYRNEGEAHTGTQEIMRQYNSHGKSAAQSYMMGLMPAEGMTPAYKRRVEAISNAMEDFKLNEQGKPKALDRSEFDHAEGTMRVLQGKQANTRTSQMAIKASRGMRAFNNISLLSFTALTSIPDAVLPLIRSGSFRNWTKGLAKFATDPVYREEIRNTGVAIENELHSRMIGMFGADVQGKWGVAQSAFFNATMLSPWTDMWRGISGAVGLESFRTQVKKLALDTLPNVDIAGQPRSVKFARRYLTRYGLNGFIDNPTKTLDPQDATVGKAMIRFANDTIFAPNANDIPLEWQTPGGAIMWQLKSFPLMMGRLSKEVIIDDIKNGNFKRLMYLAAFAPAAGVAAIGTKDIIQMRGGEEGKTAEFRIRSAAKFFGYDESVHGNEQTFLGWYIEGLIAAGGIGLLGELLHDVTSQADNGAYGFQRIAGAFLGPSFGSAASAANIYGGAKEAAMDTMDWGTSDSNAKERQAVRDVVGRIPVLGGIKKVREAAVDMAAGGKTKRTRGWGAAFSAGF